MRLHVNYLRFLGAALAVVLLSPGVCESQELARAIHVTEENDYLDFWLPPNRRPDDNYTQGLRIGWESKHTLSVWRRLLCRDTHACGSTFEVGQEMYTPTTEHGVRPFAGWLYARAGEVVATDHSRRVLSVTLGLTGPPSLAEQTQKAFHRLVPGFRHPTGWERQLPTEIDGAMNVQQTWHVSPSLSASRMIDLLPWAGGAVGTLRTSLAAGAKTRVGVGLTHPWLVDRRARKWEAYLSAGGSIEAVGRDLFLDGSTFRRSAHTEREALVVSRELGVAARYGRITLEYRAVTQGKDYPAGPSTHPFGIIGVTWWDTR
jgi:lipid A 3-O-deacylase